MEGEFRSWRLNGILNTEIAAGNSIAKASFGGSMSIVLLERAYMSPIRPGDGVVEYRKQTFDKSIFKMVYYDNQTNEYLGFRLYKKKTLFGELKAMIKNKKTK